SRGWPCGGFRTEFSVRGVGVTGRSILRKPILVVRSRPQSPARASDTESVAVIIIAVAGANNAVLSDRSQSIGEIVAIVELIGHSADRLSFLRDSPRSIACVLNGVKRCRVIDGAGVGWFGKFVVVPNVGDSAQGRACDQSVLDVPSKSHSAGPGEKTIR